MENIFKEPGIRELLESKVQALGKEWGHYHSENADITNQLKQAGAIVDLRGIERNIGDVGERWGYFVKSVLNLKPEQILLVSSGLFPDFNHQKVSKKGNLLKLTRRSEEDIETNLYKKLREVKTGNLFVGYDWQGVHTTTQEYRVTLLLDCFKAYFIDRQPFETTFGDYPGDPNVRGITLDVYSIPSLSSNKVYSVLLQHIAVYGNEEEKKIAAPTSYDLKEHHSKCQKAKWYVVKDSRGNEVSIFAHEREGDEILFDYHAITAFRRGKKHLRAQQFKVFDPFVDPTKIKNGFPYFRGLSRVIKETRDHQYIDRSHLDTLEREICLWKLFGYNNFSRESRH